MLDGENPLPCTAGLTAFGAPQGMSVCALGCEHTLTAPVQLLIHQCAQVLLLGAALNPVIPQPVLVLGTP